MELGCPIFDLIYPLKDEEHQPLRAADSFIGLEALPQ